MGVKRPSEASGMLKVGNQRVSRPGGGADIRGARGPSLSGVWMGAQGWVCPEGEGVGRAFAVGLRGPSG